MSKKKKSNKKEKAFETELEKQFFDNEEPELDEEIVRSFKPRWKRNPYVAIAVIPFTLFLIYMLWTDFTYGVRGLFSEKAKEVGDITTAISGDKLDRNTYITVKGTPFIQSLVPVPKRGKRGKKASQYYLYYILQGTDNSVVVKRLSDKPQFVGEIPGTHTGRLLRIADLSEGKRIQAYMKNNKNNRIDQDILFRPTPWSDADPKMRKLYDENLTALKKLGTPFRTDLGNRVIPKGDLKLDIKAFFSEDTFITFNRKKEFFTTLTLTGGSYAPDDCSKGVGGDLILKKDPETFSLPPEGAMAGNSKRGTLASSSCDWEAVYKGVASSKKGMRGFDPAVHTAKGLPVKPTILKNKTVRIPQGAQVRDLATGNLLAFKDGRYIIKGARAGQKPTSLKVKISYRPFEEIQGCYHWLAKKGYPFAKITAQGAIEDGNWELVARIPPEDLVALRAKSKIVKKCKKTPKGVPGNCTFIYPMVHVKPRYHFLYNIKFKDLRVQGSELLVLNARANFPKKFQVKQTDPPIKGIASGPIRMLVERRAEPTYRLALSAVNKFKLYPKTEIPDDAWVIVSDQPPGQWTFMWKIPVVLVLFLLILFNGVTIFRHFFSR